MTEIVNGEEIAAGNFRVRGEVEVVGPDVGITRDRGADITRNNVSAHSS